MCLYPSAEIKHCWTGKAFQNEKGKSVTFIRVLKNISSPSAKMPAKLPHNISTRWNVKCWCFLVNNAWPCFWAAELWLESKWLSVRSYYTQNQPENTKTCQTWCCKSYCQWASATSLLHEEQWKKLLIRGLSRWEYIQ